MDDSSDLEKGKACFFNNNGDDFDPETSLSYIDEKIQRVLGHFQKDFEGGISIKNLGAKFDGYGSFLLSRQRDGNATKSPNNFPLQGSLQNPKAPPSGRPLASSSNAVSSHKSREASGRTYSCLPSTDVINNCRLKDETLSSSGNLTKNPSLKVRIKVCSNNTAQKNAAIYSGLGLGDSPMSSSENSSDVSEGLLPAVPVDGSVSEIIQVMTAFPVPGGALVSPLHDSFLRFSRKKKSVGDIKSVIAPEDQEESLPKPVDETTSVQSEGKVVKEESGGQRERLGATKNEVHRERLGTTKNELYPCLNKVKTIFINGESEEEASGGKDFLPSESKQRYISNLSHDSTDLKPSCKDDMVKHRRKKSHSDSISRQDCLKSDKQKTTDEKAMEQKPKKSGNHVESNDYSDRKSEKLCHRPASHEKHKLSNKTGKTGILGKNKVEGPQNVGGRAASSFEEDFKIGSGAGKGRKDYNSKCESQRYRLKLPKRAPDDMQRFKNSTDSGKEKFDLKNKTKEDRKLMTSASDKDGEGASPLFSDNDPVSKVEPAVVAPVDNWVECERCQKWRLLPFGMDPEKLPKKWTCSMLSWLPGMNRCDVSEQETTEKATSLNQPPISDSARVLQNHANEPASSDTLADKCHFDQSLGLKTTSSQGRKNNNNLNKLQDPHSNITQFHVEGSLNRNQQQSSKSKSVNGLSHPPSSQLNGSIGQSVNELHNLVGGKSRLKMKEKFIDRGNCKQLKRKNMGPKENGICPVAAKKPKKERICSVDNHQDSDVDFGRLGYSSNSGLSNMEGEEDMLEYNETGLSKHAKRITKEKMPVSLKTQGKQTQISAGGCRSGNQVCDRNDRSTRKRKLKEDDQDCYNNPLHAHGYVKEDVCERLKKENKSHVSKTKDRDSSQIGDDYKPKRQCKTTQIFMSGIRTDSVKGVEETKNSCKDKKRQMGNKKIFSKQASVGKELPRRNFSSQKVSTAANSSSSKVSLSHLAKANSDMKSSPAESVSSSPLRSTRLDQRGGEKEEITSYIHSESQKIDQDNDFALNFSRVTKPSCGVTRRPVVDTSTVKKLQMGNNNTDDTMEPISKNKLKKAVPDKMFSPENKDLLISSEKDKSVLSYLDLDKAKGSDGISEQSKKCMINEPEVDSYTVAFCSDGVRDTKHSSPKKHSSKPTRKERVGASDEVLEIPRNLEDIDAADKKFCDLSQSNKTVRLLNKRTPDFESGNKGGVKRVERKNEESKRPLTLSPLGNGGNKSVINHGPHAHDQQGFRDLNASSLNRMESSSQAARHTLKEAKDLRDSAERFKSSGFGFEINEAYFQSALKFLHGAFLLETSARGKQGDMSHMQFYGIAAELCGNCAHEYERRQEMASAALAYKCIEVAHLRVVFCKHSSSRGDGYEMHHSLRAAIQGESPSSSASDVDNLSNQATMDKATFNHSAQLLDFTNDMISAMEASEKSQKAFMAASTQVREAVKKAIDFSFQDVEELIPLVEQAMEAITRLGQPVSHVNK